MLERCDARWVCKRHCRLRSFEAAAQQTGQHCKARSTEPLHTNASMNIFHIVAYTNKFLSKILLWDEDANTLKQWMPLIDWCSLGNVFRTSVPSTRHLIPFQSEFSSGVTVWKLSELDTVTEQIPLPFVSWSMRRVILKLELEMKF